MVESNLLKSRYKGGNTEPSWKIFRCPNQKNTGVTAIE